MCLDIMSDVSLLNQESLFIEYLKKVNLRNSVHIIPRLHGQHIKKMNGLIDLERLHKVEVQWVHYIWIAFSREGRILLKHLEAKLI